MSYDPLVEDKEIEIGLWPLNFEPALEKDYQLQAIECNHKQVAITWIIGIVLYDLFIISDLFAAPEYINLFLIGRFIIVTPVCLLIVALIWKKGPCYDLLAVGCSIVMTLVLSGLIAMTEGRFRSDYLFGNVLLILCGCVIGRPRMTVACPVIILQFIVYCITLQSMGDIANSTKIVGVLFCLSGAVIAFIVTYGLEQVSRRSFLLGLRVNRLNRELEQQSLTDPLTHLANRRAFEQAIKRYWSDSCVRCEPVSLILIDIDHFKLFNDTYGHSAGDHCLKRVAQCVRSAMPAGPSLAVRFGGEEIILFLPCMDFAQAHALAEEVRLSIRREAIPHSANAPGHVVSASFGIATTTAEACEAAELIIQADAALYAAKRNGRDQVWPPMRIMAGASASGRLGECRDNTSENPEPSH